MFTLKIEFKLKLRYIIYQTLNFPNKKKIIDKLAEEKIRNLLAYLYWHSVQKFTLIIFTSKVKWNNKNKVDTIAISTFSFSK